MSAWVFRILMALLLTLLVLVADVTDKRVHRERATLDPCALVLSESGQRCR